MASRFVVAFLVVTAIGAGFVALGGFGGRNHPPVRSPTKVIPYDPERIIRTTLHEYLGGGGDREHETTGRYVTFGLPMKYLDPWEVYDGEAPIHFRMLVEWQTSDDQAGQIVEVDRSVRQVSELIKIAGGRYFVSLSSSRHSSLKRLDDKIDEAKRTSRKFGGYKRGAMRDFFDLGEEYCGFEMFERDDYRDWHISAGRADGVDPPSNIESPFDRARIFALAGRNDGYRLIVECDDRSYLDTGYCTTDVLLNDYVVARFGFDGALLCEIETVIEQHVDLLREAIVDQVE